jgi:manganese efflux pump family protein
VPHSLPAWEIFLLAISLAFDAAAVSLAASAAGWAKTGRARFRLAFHFGLFQGLMPLLGWGAGQVFSGWLAAVDHWIAFGLLCWIGAAMLRGGLRGEGAAALTDPTRGWALVALSVATSIDALAVGASLSMLGAAIMQPALAIGLAAAVLSLAAILVGHRASRSLGPRLEIIGGLMLIVLGLKILVQHLH